MNSLIFDCPSGISGDMTLGALVDLGVDWPRLRGYLETLPLEGYKLDKRDVKRNAIAATQITVDVPHEHHPRHLKDIVEILEAGSLPVAALNWAKAAFRKLAEAEAAAHRTSIDEVHFHEVGAMDAIIDIAGACTGFAMLAEEHNIEKFFVSQVRVGRGVVKTQHGMMPVPAPAAMMLLKGFPVQFSQVDGERVTPTGAALLATVAKPLGAMAFTMKKLGFGAGTREFNDAANLLRLMVADVEEGGSSGGQVAVVRTTIDDMVPEFYGYLMSQLFEAGALDVYFTAIQMKKNRPGIQVTVLSECDNAHNLARLLMQESSTLGVRIAYEGRVELARHIETVHTRYGEIQVKVVRRPDGKLRRVPEYESVKGVAEKVGIPILDVYQATLGNYGSVGDDDGDDNGKEDSQH